MEERSREQKIADITKIVCDTMHVSPDELVGIKRQRDLVDARRIFVNMLIEEEKFTYTRTGKLINRNHATAIHYNKSHKGLYSGDGDYRYKYDRCMKKYRGERLVTINDLINSKNETLKLKKKVSNLEEIIKDLRYDKLKLENKIRMKQY